MRSRKHISPFNLVRARTIDVAVQTMAASRHARFVAGGIDLIDLMKSGLEIGTIISLDAIPELRGIRVEGDHVFIGALTTHAEIAESELLHRRVPGFRDIWASVANPRIRIAGTFGGNLVSALPHYDAPAACAALGAVARVRKVTGEQVAAPVGGLGDEKSTLLEGILVDVREPVRLLADRSLHPVLSIYLAVRPTGMRAAIACAFARPHVLDLPANASLAPAEVAAEVAASAPALLESSLASAAYRRRMIAVLLKRLLMRAAEGQP
jgi:carbon-monoxide dehydrogenase medium subunit